MNGIEGEIIDNPQFWLPYIENGEASQNCIDGSASTSHNQLGYDPTQPNYVPTPKSASEKAVDGAKRKWKKKTDSKKINKEAVPNCSSPKAPDFLGNVQEKAELDSTCCLYEDLRPKYNQLLHHYQHMKRRYEDLRDSKKNGNEKKKPKGEMFVDAVDTDDEISSLKSGLKKSFVKKGKK